MTLIRFSTAASSNNNIKEEREKGRAKMIIVLKLKLQNCNSLLPGDCFHHERVKNNGRKVLDMKFSPLIFTYSFFSHAKGCRQQLYS
jgi:hypothetical protein